MATEVTVVIVGAGVAGLASANRLLSSTSAVDFKVTILEGSNRAGGRIRTATFGDELVELGATWLHGTIDNPMYDLLQEVRRSQCGERRFQRSAYVGQARSVFQTKGKAVDDVLAREVMILYDDLLDDCNEIARKSMACQPYADVGSYMRKGLDDYLASARGDRLMKHRDLVESLFNFRLKQETCLSGCHSMDDVSLQWFGDYRILCGGNKEVKEGMSTLVDALVSKLPEHCICYNSVVDKICWSDSKSSEVKPVTVLTRDGRSYCADHVIFTGSLGVLKHQALDSSPLPGLFEPPLPSEKQGAIDRLGISGVDKVFIRFGKQFWNETVGRYCLCWPTVDRESKFYCNPEFSWLQKLSSLFYRHSQSPVVIGWITGEEAIKMALETDHSLCEKLREVVKYFTGKSSIPEAVDILRSNWSSDELIRGSYTYPAVGCCPDDFDILAQPLPQPACHVTSGDEVSPLQLLFAGEATHRHYYSTMHGAYMTGIREADRIKALYQENDGETFALF
jgi:monoamine oxidase